MVVSNLACADAAHCWQGHGCGHVHNARRTDGGDPPSSQELPLALQLEAGSAAHKQQAHNNRSSCVKPCHLLAMEDTQTCTVPCFHASFDVSTKYVSKLYGQVVIKGSESELFERQA